MPRPAYDPARRRSIELEIQAKALSLFALHGYRSVSMRAIAEELGWSATALYRYFDNKEALLAAIRADGFVQIQIILSDVRAQARSALEAAELAMKGYVDFALTSSALYQLMYELDQGAIAAVPDVVESRQLAFNEAIGISNDLLQEIGRTGDATEMAHLLWLSAHGLAALAVANQLDLGKTLEDLVEPAINAVLRGLGGGERLE